MINVEQKASRGEGFSVLGAGAFLNSLLFSISHELSLDALASKFRKEIGRVKKMNYIFSNRTKGAFIEVPKIFKFLYINFR